MFVLNLGFPDFINEKDVDKVVDALKFAFPNITWASGKDVASKHSYDLISRSRSLIIRQPNSDDTDLLKSSNLIDDGSLGIPEPVDGWQWVNEKLSIKKSEDEGYGTTSGFFDSLNESEEKQVRPLSLCFNPPITTETWEKVAEVLYRKGISWGAYENVWGYNPFEHDVDRIMSLQYAHWRWEDKKVLTYDTDSCEALSSNHVLETANTEDGWAWVDSNTTDFDQTSDLFNSLNESLEGGESIVYEFNDRLTEKDWSVVVNSLKVLYPGILWASEDEIDHYKNRGIFGLRVRKKFGVGYELRCSDQYNYYRSHGYSNIHDGNQLLGNYDETSSFFDSLNESLLTENYQPKLCLDFDPPIYRDQFKRVAEALLSKYPELRWHSGRLFTGDEIYDRNNIEYIGNLTIGWDSDYPDRLTYDESNVGSGFAEFPDSMIINGWQWVDDNGVNYDETSGFFDSLNESSEITKMPEGAFVIKFDPPVNSKDWYRVASLIDAVYPGLTWRRLGGTGRSSLQDYNPMAYDGDLLSYLFIGEPKPTRRIMWDTEENPPSEDDGPIIDGWELIGTNDTHDMFDQLNESIIKESSDNKILQLGFDPPLREGSSDWSNLVQVLNQKYPDIRWSSGKPVTVDYFPGDYYYVLDYGWWEGEPAPCVTYSDMESDLEDYGVIDGRKWIEENSVDYDETSDLFGQLDEQALREESLDKKITYLIEKDINIEWDAMVKILKEYFGDNVSWNGRGDISKLPSVGNNWQTLAIKYDNFYNRFLVNFGRDKPQRYFELYPEHELIKLSEVSTDIDNTSNLFNQLNESTGNGINKYKVGDKFYCKEDLRFNDVLKDRFATKGHTYEIIKIEPDYDWHEYGYRGNRYVFLLDGEKPEDANHGFSDRYIDKNFIYIPEDINLEVDFDKLYESEEDDLGWAQEITSNVPNRVSHNNLYFGMKVLPGGPHWNWGTQGQDAEYGTIEPYPEGDSEGELFKLEDENDYGPMGGYWVQVIWRDKDGRYLDENNYRVGPRYFDLKYYFEDTNLNEGYWDDLYKSKRYTQKFGIGDRVIMNGSVGGKTFRNELGTVLKYKLTGGGVGHPHRVYLILFDNWNDKKGNFLMSSSPADQNREFYDARCGEGSCWYSISDNLEPAPDSNEMFDTLNESEDLDWTNDIVDSNSNFEPQGGEWIVVDTGQHYPWNPDMWQYFEIPGFNECLEDGTSYGVINANRECIDDLYARGILVHPRIDDICYVNKKVWTKVTTFSKKLPVYHCIRKSDGGHFLVTSKGVEPFSSQ